MKILTSLTIFIVLLSLSDIQAVQKTSELKVLTYTADDAGFDVNSHLIVGPKSALLVDAQFTRSQAKKVVEMIQSTNKNLTTIFITHGHPDHYLGLEIIHKAFPTAKIVALPSIIEDIKTTGPGKLAYWKPIYKIDLADEIIYPAPLTSKNLIVDGERIRVLIFREGESAHSAALYIPLSKSLLSGDLLYNGVHLWLAEDRPEGWLANLKKLSNIAIEKIYPGHGPDAGEGLIAENIKYIETFQNITKDAITPEAGVAELKKLYPDFHLPIIAELSVGQRFKDKEASKK